jgi:hypothetical protein
MTFNGGLLTKTPDVYYDWFLPSKGDMEALISSSLYTFTEMIYLSSSEENFSSYHAYFGDDSGAYLWQQFNKGVNGNFIPIRTFTIAETSYSLVIGDAGQGGKVYYRSTDGTTSTYYEYYEDAVSLGTEVWSNVESTLIGTTSVLLGTGQANTTAIISQAGHTASAAKECNDLIKISEN